MAEIPRVDADLRNADWTKRTLDVWTRDGSRLVSNVDELAAVLGVTVEDVKRLPVYQGALRHWKALEDAGDG